MPTCLSAEGSQTVIALSEHDEQVLVVDWLRACGVMCFAVPNGAKLSGNRAQRVKQWKWLQAEGALKGAPDLIVAGETRPPVAIEMKRQKRYRGKKPGADQLEVHRAMRDRGWIVLVCYGFDDARAQLLGLGIGR